MRLHPTQVTVTNPTVFCQIMVLNWQNAEFWRFPAQPAGSRVQLLDSDIEVVSPEVEHLDAKVQVLVSEVELLDAEVLVLSPNMEHLDTNIEPVNSEVAVVDAKVEVARSEVEHLDTNFLLADAKVSPGYPPIVFSAVGAASL